MLQKNFELIENEDPGNFKTCWFCELYVYCEKIRADFRLTSCSKEAKSCYYVNKTITVLKDRRF